MATPVLSRLSRVLVWAKAGSANPNVRSNSDNFFIPLLVGGERATLQQSQTAKPQQSETVRQLQVVGVFPVGVVDAPQLTARLRSHVHAHAWPFTRNRLREDVSATQNARTVSGVSGAWSMESNP
jgi:hypothetical protein